MESYQSCVEQKIAESITSFGPKSPLRDAVEYSLTNGGKRTRSSLVYLIASEIGKNQDVGDAALAVEFFHTASLIADDLPCMDNDDLRRGVPSLHKKFGEAAAILATYALIAEGYERIRLASQNCSFEVMQLAFAYATKNTGILGATGGQYLDLYNPENIQLVIEKKTGTLFEIAFVFGWLFGGGDINEIERVKKAAHHFGMAFQLRDDLEDIDQDSKEKNYALSHGKNLTKQTFHQTIEQFAETIDSLKLNAKRFLMSKTSLSNLSFGLISL